MEYLGHTQSADYTFGPWKMQGFRTSTFLPAVNRQQQQQQGYPFPEYGRAATSIGAPGPFQQQQPKDFQQQQQQFSPLANGQSQTYQRGYTSLNCGGVGVGSGNGSSCIRPDGGCLVRSKTCIGVGGGVNGCQQQFDASCRPPAYDDLSARDRFQLQQPCTGSGGFTSRLSPSASGGCTGNGYGSMTGRYSLNGGGCSSGDDGTGKGAAPTALDWSSWTRAELSAADRARSGSELVRADVLTLCRDATDRTRKTQTDTTRRLGDRVQEVKFWRDEVRKETELVETEKRALQQATVCLERALEETAEPLRIAEECMRLRRQKIDNNLVHDEVERELLLEIEGLKDWQDHMARLLREVKGYAISSEPLRDALVRDSAEKQVALRLDRGSHQLRQTSQGLQYINGIEDDDSTITDVESWIRYTNDLVAKSQADRATSADARSRIDDMLNRSATAILKQWNTVNATTSDRVRDYIEARNKLQTQLAKVLQEMVELDKSAELLRKTIRDKEAPLMLAQTRLATRVPRPNMESCRDQAQNRLVNEVHEIRATVDQLMNKLQETECSMQNLQRTRAALERDLVIKNNSIHVDRDLNLCWRKSFDMKPRSCVVY